MIVQAEGELPTVSEAEPEQLPELLREQVLRQWNTTQPYPRGECIHEQFEAQAARTPDATARATTATVSSETKISDRSICLAGATLRTRVRRLSRSLTFRPGQRSSSSRTRRKRWVSTGRDIRWTGMVRRLIDAAASRTHAIGAALFRDLAEGESFGALHRLAAALAAGGSPVAPARELVAIGHSSGWDMLAGFAIGAAGTTVLRSFTRKR